MTERDVARSIARRHEWVYPIPTEVGEYLDQHGADRDDFQELIRAAQPFAPMLQQSRCMTLAVRYVKATHATQQAIAQASCRRADGQQ
jgi:hypothetical protein